VDVSYHRRLALCTVCLVLIIPLNSLGFLTSAWAQAQSLNTNLSYSDFSSIAGLTLNGNAGQAGNVLRLTSAGSYEAGSAWFNTPQNVAQGFTTVFQFQITPVGGADGFAFLIQNSGLTALGGNGGYMGYDGIPNSIAVEFDTYQNGWGDISNNELAVHTGGFGTNSASESYALAPGPITPTVVFHDGLVHTAKIAYGNGVMSIFIDDLTNPILVVPVNISSTLNLSNGAAYVGFTAGTGALVDNHDILSWSFGPEATAGGANLQLQITDNANNPISGIVAVVSNATTHEFYNAGATSTDGTTLIESLPVGLVMVTALPRDLPFTLTVQNFTLASGNNTETIRMPGLPTGRLTGHVTYQNGTSAPGVFIVASQHLNRDWNFHAITNTNGNYNLTLLAGQANLIASSSNALYPGGQTVNIPVNGTVTLDTTVIALGPGSVTINLFTQYLGQSQYFGPLPIDWRVSVHYSLNVIDALGNSYLASQNPVPITGYSGEPIRVCVNGGQAGLPSLCQPGILDSNRDSVVSLYLAQQGLIKGTVMSGTTQQPVSSWSANVYSLNASGFKAFVQTISNNTANLSFSPSISGLYEIDIVSVSSAGQQLYGSVTTLVQQAQILQLGSITLSPSLYFAGMNGNSLTSSPTQTTPGGTVNLRATFRNNAQTTLTGTSILLEIPAEVIIVSGSIEVNHVQVSPTISGRYNAISVGDLAPGALGVLTYQLELSQSFNATMLDPSVSVNYTLSGTQYQEVVGVGNIRVSQLTLDAPSTLASLSTVVSGQGPPGSTVTVYDNYTVLGQVTVPEGGFWNLNVTLPYTGNQTLHSIHAQALTVSGVTLASNALSVLYDPSQPQLTQMCMQQTDGRRVCFNPSQGTAEFPYVVVPGIPLTFELSFTNPAAIRSADVVVDGVGGTSASLGTDGIFRATMVPSGGLGSVYVVYSPEAEPVGNGTLPVLPSTTEILASLPSDFQNANYTVTNVQNTTQSISFDEQISNLINGTSIITSATIQENVSYAPTPGDLQALQATGLPLYNFNLTVPSGTGEIDADMSYFVPYSVLPMDLAIALGDPYPVLPNKGAEFLIHFRVPYNTAFVNPYQVHAIDAELAATLKQLGVSLSKIAQGLNSILSAWSVGQAFYKAKAFANLNNACGNSILQKYPGNIDLLNQNNGFLWENFYLAMIETFVKSSSVARKAFLINTAFFFGSAYLDSLRNELNDNYEAFLEAWCPQLAAHPLWVYDPSGYAYEALPSNRLADVTVSLFQQDPNTRLWSLWDASGFGQQNPEQTDTQGRYGWDVPAGTYKVVFQKPGYSIGTSTVLNVPPPATDVNVNMMSLAAPRVTGVSAVASNGNSYVEIAFSSYMQTSLLTPNTVRILSSGLGLAGIIVPLNPQPDPNGVLLAREAQFLPTTPLVAGATYSVQVSHLAEDYANVQMGSDFTMDVVAQTGSNYRVMTSRNAVDLGEAISANATTTNALSASVLFTLYGPGNNPMSRQLVPTSSGIANASPFYPSTIGVWTITASFTDGSTTFRVSSTSFIVGGTSLVYKGAFNAEYGDVVIMSATLTSEAGTGGVANKAISFFFNGQQIASGITNSSGITTAALNAGSGFGPTLGNGAYPVYAGFSGDSSWLASTSTTPQFSINKEDTTIAYTGQTVQVTTGKSFTLRATVQVDGGTEPNGPFGGVLTNTSVNFTIFTTSLTPTKLGSFLVPVSTVSGLTGTATLTLSCTSGNGNPPSSVTCGGMNLSEGAYDVQVQVDPKNSYFSSPISDGVVSVYVPTGQFVTGGGWVADPSSLNPKNQANFGFVVRFSKTGQVQGQSVYIYKAFCVAPAPTSDLCEIMIKSNAWMGLGFYTQTINGMTQPCASFQSKSNVQETDTITGLLYSVQGNNQMTVYACQGNSASNPAGTYAMQDLAQSGTMLHATTLYHSGIAVGGGSIVVHNNQFVHTISISPSNCAPGATVAISGTGFAPLTTIKVMIGSVVMATTSTDSSGSFSTTFKAPSTSGTYTVTVSDGTNSAWSNLTVS